jgi:hypothetical protein
MRINDFTTFLKALLAHGQSWQLARYPQIDRSLQCILGITGIEVELALVAT